MSPLVFAFPEDAGIGRALSEALGAELGGVESHRFPDEETLITLHGACAQRDVVIVRGWGSPDAKALPFWFAAATAHDLGARSVGCVSPYLAYMRQDTQFHPGETRSASAFAHFLSNAVDWVVTVDPHLHRLTRLEEAFKIPATAVTAVPAVADWIAQHVSRPVLIGPDRESAQWAERVAKRLAVPWAILEKTRTGDREVRVSLPDPAILQGRSPVIVDDIVSSGRTLVETLQGLHRLGAPPATCIVVHALFAGGAERSIRAAGVANLVSTNTVRHPTNQIDVVPLIADAVRARLPDTRLEPGA
jgi:ribose-phosphate pyrophosphokinase